MVAGRNYSSTAQPTTLAATINNSQTTATLSSTTGLPAVPFVLVIEPGTANAEAVLVTAMSGANITAMTRGFDSTTAIAHSINAPVQHSHVALDFREALGPLGPLQTYTPTVANMTLGNGSITGRYQKFGNLVFLRIYLLSGTTTTYTATSATFSLPPGLTAYGTGGQVLTGFMNGNCAGVGSVAAGGTVITPLFSSSTTNPLLTGVTSSTFNPGAGTGGFILLEGWLEVQ